MSEDKPQPTPGSWLALEEGLFDLSVQPGICYTDLSDYKEESECEQAIVNFTYIAAMPRMCKLLESLRNGAVLDPQSAADELLSDVEYEVESRLRCRRRKVKRSRG